MSVRRHTLIVITAMCALCVLLVWYSAFQGPQIKGKFSRDELAVIVSLVRQRTEVRPILPDYSLRSLRQLPQTIRLPRCRIISIIAIEGAVEVDALLACPPEKGLTRVVTCTLRKSTNTWEVTKERFWIGPESLRR